MDYKEIMKLPGVQTSEEHQKKYAASLAAAKDRLGSRWALHPDNSPVRVKPPVVLRGYP